MELSEQDITRLRCLQIENQHRPKPEGATGIGPNECDLCGERWPCERGLLLEGLRRAAAMLRSYTEDMHSRRECDECLGEYADDASWDIMHEPDCTIGQAEVVLMWPGGEAILAAATGEAQP